MGTPLIGRIAERELLVSAVVRAQGGPQRTQPASTQLVTLIGSPGVGKTRLLTEIVADLAETVPDVRCFRGACRAEGGTDIALGKILRQRLSLTEGADVVTQALEMRMRVTELFGDRRVQEILHFLGAFLGLRFGGTPIAEAIEDDARAFEQVSRAVLRRFFEVDAQRGPIVLLVDDLHLASEDSIKGLAALWTSLRAAPLVLVAAGRPELEAHSPTWFTTLPGRHTRVELAPLNSSETSVLVRSLLGGATAESEVLIERAVEFSGGNPLLAERIVDSFFAQGVVKKTEDSIEIDLEKLDGATFPLSMEDAVRARLASLTPSEREVLEAGALMGPVFWLGGLVVLGRAQREAPDLWGGGEDLAPHFRDLLAGLQAREFVLRMPDSSLADEEEWIFKHNRERELLEALVPAERSTQLHLLLAEWLECRLGERTEEQLDLLAYHYERADRPLRAARCFLESADRARARYGNTKAAAGYRRGLELLGDYDVRLRLEAHHHLGEVLQLLGQTDDAEKEFRSMLALAYRLDQRARGGAAHDRLGRLFRETGRLELAMRHLGTALALYESAGDERGVATAYDDIGKVHWMRGSYEQALRYLQDALGRREALGDKRSIALSLNNLALVYQDSGQYRAALEAITRALELRREVEDLPGLTITLNNIGTIYQDRGDDEQALSYWREGLQIAREVGDRRTQVLLQINIGEAYYRLRRPQEALELLLEVEQLCQDLNERFLLAETWRGIGKAHLLLGGRDAAREYLERSVDLFVQTRSKVQAGIAKRSLGECLASHGPGTPEAIQAHSLYLEALKVFADTNSELEYARTARVCAALIEADPGATEEDRKEAQSLRRQAAAIASKLQRATPNADEVEHTGAFYLGETGQGATEGRGTVRSEDRLPTVR